jgi:ZIP family zinc transporter
MLYLIAAATFVATFLGGQFALRFKDKLHLILGFSAGAVIGVAFFDLLPESLELSEKSFGPPTTCIIVAAGFLFYLVLDRLVLFHAHHHDHLHEGHEQHELAQIPRGLLGAASLSVHSFLDGVAIGLAFQVSAAVGYIVAFAVLAHDFSDGINTVNFLLKNKADKALAFKWLIVDALAPVLGVAVTLLFSVTEEKLGAILALFTGFFIYIGASELIPESYHSHPKLLTTLMTVLGVVTMFVVIRLAGV